MGQSPREAMAGNPSARYASTIPARPARKINNALPEESFNVAENHAPNAGQPDDTRDHYNS